MMAMKSSLTSLRLPASSVKCRVRAARLMYRSVAVLTESTFDNPVRELLFAAYLRPPRDVEQEMSQGRGSRLSQIFFSVPEISQGEKIGTENLPMDAKAVGRLGFVGLSDQMCSRSMPYSVTMNHECTYQCKSPAVMLSLF